MHYETSLEKISPRRTNHPAITQIKSTDNNLLTQPRDIAEKLNSFFTELGERLAENIVTHLAYKLNGHSRSNLSVILLTDIKDFS